MLDACTSGPSRPPYVPLQPATVRPVMLTVRRCVRSAVQSADLQIHIEQAASRAVDDQCYTDLTERSRSAKSRAGRLKSRRSVPYTPVGQPECAAQYPDRPYDYSTTSAAADLAIPPAPPSYNLELSCTPTAAGGAVSDCKYGALYRAAAYGRQMALYGDSGVGLYPYVAARHRYLDERDSSPYRGHPYGDKYYLLRDNGSFNCYANYALTAGDEEQDDAKRTLDTPYRPPDYRPSRGATDASTDVTYRPPEYRPSRDVPGDVTYAASSAPCSRSSSRDDCCVGAPQPSQLATSAYTTSTPAYSHRSESSLSDDVDVVSDEYRRPSDRLPRRLQSPDVAARGATDAGPCARAGSQQSVIMCRQSLADNQISAAIADMNCGSRDDGKQPQVNGAVDTDAAARAVTAFAADHYASYKQCMSSYQADDHQTPYTEMQQAGYTSVIVDTQQYHMANGFVH